MSAYPDHILRVGSQHLAELKRKTAEFERHLWDAHESLEYELTQSWYAPQDLADPPEEAFRWDADGPDPGTSDAAEPAGGIPVQPAGSVAPEGAEPEGPPYSRENRTADLVSHGRRGATRRHRIRGVVLAAAGAAVIAAGITALMLDLSRPGPAWPASVAKVQREIAVACQNPDVAAEPSQLNFACARSTRQILWVFSLLTSRDNPDYASIKTGRQGLEPITPAQGGEVAWSLNLHHPYNPANPVDSIEVAARAINNIIGGATLTAANGRPVVQSGLESISANCARYTGSGALTTRRWYPDLCAKPITSAAGLGYLVADVFQKWVVGAPPSAAQDAAVLFMNARNPGNPRVRAILRSIQTSNLRG